MAPSTPSPNGRPQPPAWFGLRDWISRSVENRIAASSLALALATVVLLGALSYHFSITLIRDGVQLTVRQESELTAARIEATLDHLAKEHAAAAASTLTANALTDSQGLNTYLIPFLRQGWIATELGFNIALCDFRGTLISAAISDGPDICREFPHPSEVIESSRPRAVILHERGVITIAAPVIYLATGQAEGMLVARGPIRNLIDRSKVRRSADFAMQLQDADGRRLFEDTHGATRDSQLTAVRRISAPAPLDTLGLSLRLRADERAIYAPLWSMTALYALIGLLIVGLVTAASRIIARRVARPLLKMLATVEQVGADARAGEAVPVEGKDEVAQLATAFNAMLNKLRASYDTLEARVEMRTNALRAAEQRLASVLDSVEDIIWSTSADGKRVLYINPAIERVTGVSPRQFYDSPEQGKAITHPDDQLRYRNALLQAQQDGSSMVEIRIRRTDGSTGWLRCRFRSVHGASGTLERIDGIASDITESRRIQAVIEENAYRLNSIFQLSPDGFVSFDRQGRLASCNPAFIRMTGLDEDRLKGIDFAAFDALLGSLVDPSKPFIPTEELFKRMLANAPSQTIDRMFTPTLVHVLRPRKRVLSRSARSGPSGWPELVLYFRDVTHETEVDRMKSEFLSAAAHELRTPMASIYGFSELLLKRKYDETIQRELLETINRQAHLLTKMINELLDLARIEARAGKDFNFQPVEVASLVDSTVKSLMIPGDPRRVEVSVSAPLRPVLADRDKLQQALTNVLSNAYKYSPDGGAITLTARLDHLEGREHVSITIGDQGIGMTPTQKARAFERFYRADASGSIPGTGLGLALVKEIVEIHHGKVTLESESGRGTRVTLLLPVHSHAPPA